MKNLTRILVLLVLAGQSNAAHAQRSGVESLSWLAGCWKLARGTTVVDEQWMYPAGGAMLGMSRTVTNGRLREFEHLRIHAAGDTLVYTATPSRQATTEFRTTTVSSNEVTFENPAHDFPQRIQYRLASPTELVATISGDRENRRRPVTFSYMRAACDQPPTPAP